MSVLLSIIIPTKNRYEYLLPVLKIIGEMNLQDMEIVVQDNSDDNAPIVDFLNKMPLNVHINYFYTSGNLSQSQNSDLAVEHAVGKFVCYIGDDDVITADILPVTRWLDRQGIDACSFPVSLYYWSDVTFKSIHYKCFRLESTVDNMIPLDPKKELSKVLSSGGVTIGNLPKCYHGIVKRSFLTEIHDQTGAYFPGESPDMAVAVSLALLMKKHVYLPIYLIVSGYGGKSAGGKGLAGKHKSELGKVSQLSKNVESNWDKRIPKIWLACTIWCDSCVKALQRMGREDMVAQINFQKLYAHLIVYHPDCRAYLKTVAIKRFKFWFYSAIKFMRRLLYYVKNRLANSFHKKTVRQDQMNIIEAKTLTEAYNRERIKKWIN